MRSALCLRGAMLGLLAGVTAVAEAQEVAAPPTTDDAAPPWTLDLARYLGIPAALMVAGWRTGRMAERASERGIPLVIRLHPDDRDAIMARRETNK